MKSGDLYVHPVSFDLVEVVCVSFLSDRGVVVYIRKTLALPDGSYIRKPSLEKGWEKVGDL
jgi:hypothetical protein